MQAFIKRSAPSVEPPLTRMLYCYIYTAIPASSVSNE